MALCQIWVNYDHIFINFECCLWYLREECGDFVHIRYSYQVWCVAHACKIAFGSVPNLNNYGHCFIHFVYLLWYLREEWVYSIHIWYSNQVPCVADSCKIALCSMPNLINYANIFILCVCCNITEKNGLILFIFGTIINHNRDLMHVKYTMALYQNVVFISIIS